MKDEGARAFSDATVSAEESERSQAGEGLHKRGAVTLAVPPDPPGWDWAGQRMAGWRARPPGGIGCRLSSDKGVTADGQERREGSRGHLPPPPSASWASAASLSCLRRRAPRSPPRSRDVPACRGLA